MQQSGDTMHSDVLHVSQETNTTIKDIHTAMKGERSLTDWKAASDLNLGAASLKYYELKWLAVAGLRVCQNLRSIRLDRNSFENDSMQLFCKFGLACCKKLTSLSLAGCYLNERDMLFLGPALGHLADLSFLTLDGNLIGHVGALYLADGLGTCRNLCTLSVVDCELGDEGLSHLRTKVLPHNPITVLMLGSNKITDTGVMELARAGLHHCPKLVSLGLSDNHITDVGMQCLSSEGLPHCPLLVNLGLSRNRITEVGWKHFLDVGLPHCLYITDLVGVDLSLYVDDWSLAVDFQNRDNCDIITYLRNAKGDALVETSRVKVMLVGPGEAGKTTLVHKLITNKFRANQFEMTDGVDMHTWEHENIEFQLWDFGGQEIYLNTHAMFFETRCIYMITWSARASYAGDILKLLDQYFQNVQNRAPNAPILLVSTHAKDVPPLSPETVMRLREKYPTILDYVHVDSQSTTASGNIAQLKRALVDATRDLPFVRQQQPKKFVTVEDYIKTICRPDRFTLESGAFTTIAGTFGLPDRQSALLLSLLHQWGAVHVLSKGDIVLQPQQLADVMRRVVTGKTTAEGDVKATSNGVLQHADIGSIWSTYKECLRPQFLDLLHKCELAYPLYNAAGIPLYQSLVPAMLANEHSSLDEMSERCFPGFEEHRGKYGKINIKFKAHSANFFPMLQARLRAMATRDGAWQQYYFICLEDNQTGDLCTALLHNDPSNFLVAVIFPLTQATACSAALRAMRYLLDEHFKALVIVGLEFEFETRKLTKKALLTQLQRDRNATCAYDDDEGNSCRVSLGPLRVLLTELDETAVTSQLLRDPRDIFVHSALAVALQKVKERGSSQPDLADLSIELIRSIPDISRMCEVSHVHVNVIWLMHEDKMRLIPVSPGKAASDPWKLVPQAAISTEGLLFQTRSATSSDLIVWEAFVELGLPRDRGFYFAPLGEFQDQLIEAQTKHFEKVTIADGVDAYLQKSHKLTRMSTMQQILTRLDQIHSTVLTIESTLQDFRRDFDIAIKRVGRQIADLSPERLYALSENIDSTVDAAQAAPVTTPDELEDLIASMRTKLFVADSAGDVFDAEDAVSPEQQTLLDAIGAPFRELLDVLAQSARDGRITKEELLRLKADAIASVQSLSGTMHMATHSKLLSRELTQSVIAKLLTQPPPAAGATRKRGTAAVPALTADHLRAVLKEELSAMEQRLSAQEDSYHHQLVQENVLQASKIDHIMNAVAELKKNVEVVRSVQVDSLYRLQDIPLILSITDPEANGISGWVQRRYAKVFRVHCVCPVCGRKAPSGRNKTGYKLIITKDWVIKLANVLTVLLKTVQIISLASPVPLPHLGDLAQYLPRDTTILERGLGNMLDEAQTAINDHCDRIRDEHFVSISAHPLPGGNATHAARASTPAPAPAPAPSPVPGSIPVTAAATATPTVPPSQLSFPVTIEYITSVISLLHMVEDSVPPQHSELRMVRYQDLDQFAWVCKDSAAAVTGLTNAPTPPPAAPGTVLSNVPTQVSQLTQITQTQGTPPAGNTRSSTPVPAIAPMDCRARFAQQGNQCLNIVISKV